MPPHGDRVEAMKRGRAFADEREELVGRQKERGGGADGDGVDVCLLAEDELDLAHGLAGDSRREHHAAPAFARHDRDLAGHDEVQALRLFSVRDELLAPLEGPRLQPLDQAGALGGGHRGDERRRPPEVRHGMPATKRGELDSELGMTCRDRLDRASSRNEQNRRGRRRDRAALGKCDMSATSPTSAPLPTRPSTVRTRLAPSAARREISRLPVATMNAAPESLPSWSKLMARRYERRLEGFEKLSQRLSRQGAEERQWSHCGEVCAWVGLRRALPRGESARLSMPADRPSRGGSAAESPRCVAWRTGLA